MVLPVTAHPRVVTNGLFDVLIRDRWSQAMPIDRPLPYYMNYVHGVENVHWTTQSFKRTDLGLYLFEGGPSSLVHARNVAYERLKDAVYDQAGWGENLAQINKSRDLINRRATQLAKFVSAVRRGRFGEAARTLKVSFDPSIYKRGGMASTFLEYQYGIAPVVQDIQTSVNILTKTVFWHQRMKGRCRTGDSFKTLDTHVSGNWSYTYSAEGSYRITSTCYTGIRVDNPNLFLANQLGVLDTALPWKLIPFSFVVDWFVNVEQVLSSMTDWYGCSLLHPHWTDFVTMHDHFRDSQTNAITGEYVWSEVDRTAVEMRRSLGLPAPELVVKPFRGLSLKRGIESISLIVAVLGRK
jgi:hypothetical protein